MDSPQFIARDFIERTFPNASPAQKEIMEEIYSKEGITEKASQKLMRIFEEKSKIERSSGDEPIEKLTNHLINEGIVTTKKSSESVTKAGSMVNTQNVLRVNFKPKKVVDSETMNIEKHTFSPLYFEDRMEFSKIDVVRELIRRNFDEGAEFDIKVNLEFAQDRLNADGTKMKEDFKRGKFNYAQLKSLDDIDLFMDEVFLSGIGSGGEMRADGVRVKSGMNIWVIVERTSEGGAFVTTTLKQVDKSHKIDKKKLESLGFFMRKNTKKYKLRDGSIALNYERKETKKKNMCFWHALKYYFKGAKIKDLKGNSWTPMKIKKQLKIKKFSAIDYNKHVPRISRLLGINIEVYDIESNILICSADIFTELQDKKQVKLLLENYHYFALITEEVERGVMNMDKLHLVYYDFETVINELGICNVYSYSYCTQDANEGVQFYMGEDALEHFYLSLRQLKNRLGKKLILVSHNGDRFDNILLYDYIMANERYALKIKRQGSQITNLSNYIINSTLDMCKLLVGSLKRCCKDYGVAKDKCKGEIDHKEIQAVYDKEGFAGISQKFGKKLQEYNDLDVISLRELYVKFRDEILDIGNHFELKIKDNIFLYYKTIGGISRYISNQYAKSRKVPIPAQVQEFKDFKMLRKSLYGGKSHRHVPKPVKVENYASIDYVSLYPTCMSSQVCDPNSEELIDHIYPEGDCVKVKELIKCDYHGYKHPLLKYQIGIYKLRNIDQSHLKHKIIPNRTEAGLDWGKDIIDEAILTTIDIAHLDKYNCKYEVIEGFVWENANDHYFDPFIKEVYKIKQKEDVLKYNKEKFNKSRRETTKIILNSAFGKGCENIHREFNQIIGWSKGAEINKELISVKERLYLGDKLFICGEYTDKYFKDNWKKFKKKYTVAGCFVTAYSRYYMYSFIYKYQDVITYTDTDSLHIPYKCWLEIKKERPWLIPKNGVKLLGQLENEFEDYGVAEENICYYIDKKMYCICDKDGNPRKYRCKGVTIKAGNDIGIYYDEKDKDMLDIRDDREFIPFIYEDQWDKENERPKFGSRLVNIKYMFDKLLETGVCSVRTIQWSRKNIMEVDCEGSKAHKYAVVMIEGRKKTLDINKKNNK